MGAPNSAERAAAAAVASLTSATHGRDAPLQNDISLANDAQEPHLDPLGTCKAHAFNAAATATATNVNSAKRHQRTVARVVGTVHIVARCKTSETRERQ